MHTPTPDNDRSEEQPEVDQPPVPPDQEPDVVPVQEPPKPGGEPAPMIAAMLPGPSRAGGGSESNRRCT